LSWATPKITDFGLAKLTELAADASSAGALTRTGQVLGTAAYMAPEQARGSHTGVGPAADVYALGVMLYELLTGRVPFRGETDWETLRQAQTEEPLPPRRLRPKLPRDLETICLKCLQKEPPKRYRSAGELADDLHRFLRGEPIRARPVGVAGRAWRWCRRRPAVAGLLAALAVLLLSSLTVVTWFWRLAEDRAVKLAHERDEAEKTALAAVQAVDDSFWEVRRDELVAMEGTTPSRQKLLEGALRYNLEFLQRRADDPKLQEQAARAYHRVGVIYTALGKPAEALAALQAGLTRAEELLRARPDDPACLRLLGEHQHLLGVAHHDAGRPGEALPLMERACATFARLATTGADPPGEGYALAQTYLALGEIQRDLDRAADALASCERARQLLEPLVRAHPARGEYQSRLARTHLRASQCYRLQRSPEKERAALREALRAQEKVAADHPAVPRYRRELAHLLVSLAKLEVDAGRWDAAPPPAERALPILQQLTDGNPNAILLQGDFAQCLYVLGRIDVHRGKREEAMGHFRRARAILEQLVRQGPQLLEYRSLLGVTLSQLAVRLHETRQSEEAVRLLGEAIGWQQQVVREGPAMTRHRQVLSGNYNTLAKIQSDLGRPKDVAATLELGRASAPDHPNQVFFAASCLAAAVARRAEQTKALSAAEQAELRTCADQAMDLLRQAVARGFNDVARLQKEAAWKALHGRADFQELIRDIHDASALRPGARARAQAQKSLVLTLLTQQAQAAEKQGDWSAATTHLGQMIQVQPDEWTHHARRGRAATALGKWDAALADFGKALALRPDAREIWPDYAAVLLLRGDLDGYRRFCAEVLGRFHPSADLRTSFLLARVCALGPEAVPEAELPLRPTERTITGYANRTNTGFLLHTVGLILYRTGRFEEAVKAFQASLKAEPGWPAQVLNRLGLALACHRLGQAGEALRWLDQAVQWLDQEAPKQPKQAPGLFALHPHDWLAGLLLRREAEALLGGAKSSEPTNAKPQAVP
jgi:tetratricopeptide (TPR) repeat protein